MTVIQVATPGPRGATGATGATGNTGAMGPQGPQGNPAIGGKWQAGQPARLINVATRTGLAADSLSGMKQANSRSIHKVWEAMSAIGTELPNWFVTSSNPPLGERGPGAGVTYTAGIEYPLGGVNYPLTFNGSQTGYAYDTSSVCTDLVTVPGGIQPGVPFAIVYNAVCDAGGAVVIASDNLSINTNAGHCFEYAASGLTNRAHGVGSFASTSTVYSQPLAIFGMSANPSIGIIGDSRNHGFNDDGANNLDVGETARTVGKTRPYMNLAYTGEETLNIIDTGYGYGMRGALLRKDCTHIYCNYGINDIWIANSPNQNILSRLQTIRQHYPNHWWYQTTYAPETLPGQPSTPQGGSQNGYWVGMNNMLRGPTTPFDAVYDVASVVEASRNSGTWKTAYVGPDGIHESPAGYAAIAAAGVILVP